MKNVLKEYLAQNFITVKVRYLPADKPRDGFDEEYDKFWAQINCMCSVFGQVGGTYDRFLFHVDGS